MYNCQKLSEVFRRCQKLSEGAGIKLTIQNLKTSNFQIRKSASDPISELSKMNQVKVQCVVRTTRKVQCKRLTIRESGMCCQHEKLQAQVLPEKPKDLKKSHKKVKAKPKDKPEHKPEEEECCVCLDTIVKKNLSCGHPVCRSCLHKLVSKKCPLCRKEISKKDL
jgi:hypothetical protein